MFKTKGDNIKQFSFLTQFLRQFINYFGQIGHLFHKFVGYLVG